MKKILSVIMFCLVMSFAFAMSGTPTQATAGSSFKTLGDTVNGVEDYFSALYHAGRLGKPLKKPTITHTAESEIPFPPYTLITTFDGVIVHICSESKRSFPYKNVNNVEITKNKWNLPGGINIGMTRTQIEAMFKKDTATEKFPEKGAIDYQNMDSMTGVTITYKNNVAVKMRFYSIYD